MLGGIVAGASGNSGWLVAGLLLGPIAAGVDLHTAEMPEIKFLDDEDDDEDDA